MGILDYMLSVSIIIPAWNESEHIADCLTCATRQTMAAQEILVVDNKSTDNTVDIVRRFIQENPDAHVQLLEQDAEQGLIPTRNYGFNHATGDILGRVDSDSMLRPDWVEVVSGIFTEDHDAMGATGPVAYYDMPAATFGRHADNIIRRHIYKADNGRTLLFGSNMAVRATAWQKIKNQVCRDKEDIMHEDIDISLHLIGNGMATVYSPRMVVGMSARRMDTSLKSFLAYMRRFRNTFAAHPEHTRKVKPEYFLTAMYPILHSWYPVYQRYLRSNDIDPAERVWIKQQMELAQKDAMDTWTHYHDVLAPEGVNLTQQDDTAFATESSRRVRAAQKKVIEAQKRLHRAEKKKQKAEEKTHHQLQKKASQSAKRTMSHKRHTARRAARQARKAAQRIEKKTRREFKRLHTLS